MPRDEHFQHAAEALFADLESQADGLHLADRAVEVGELTVAEYAEVELVARLLASVGEHVHVSTLDQLELRGTLTASGSDWLLVQDGHGSAWFARLAQVATISGLGPRSVPAQARPASARLSLRSALRGLSEERRPCVLHLVGGRAVRGVLTRVGVDFVEVQVEGSAARSSVVPVAALAVVQDRV